jgi:hypothetical protein
MQYEIIKDLVELGERLLFPQRRQSVRRTASMGPEERTAYRLRTYRLSPQTRRRLH